MSRGGGGGGRRRPPGKDKKLKDDLVEFPDLSASTAIPSRATTWRKSSSGAAPRKPSGGGGGGGAWQSTKPSPEKEKSSWAAYDEAEESDSDGDGPSARRMTASSHAAPTAPTHTSRSRADAIRAATGHAPNTSGRRSKKKGGKSSKKRSSGPPDRGARSRSRRDMPSSGRQRDDRRGFRGDRRGPPMGDRRSDSGRMGDRRWQDRPQYHGGDVRQMGRGAAAPPPSRGREPVRFSDSALVSGALGGDRERGFGDERRRTVDGKRPTFDVKINESEAVDEYSRGPSGGSRERGARKDRKSRDRDDRRAGDDAAHRKKQIYQSRFELSALQRLPTAPTEDDDETDKRSRFPSRFDRGDAEVVEAAGPSVSFHAENRPSFKRELREYAQSVKKMEDQQKEYKDRKAELRKETVKHFYAEMEHRQQEKLMPPPAIAPGGMPFAGMPLGGPAAAMMVPGMHPFGVQLPAMDAAPPSMAPPTASSIRSPLAAIPSDEKPGLGGEVEYGVPGFDTAGEMAHAEHYPEHHTEHVDEAVEFDGGDFGGISSAMVEPGTAEDVYRMEMVPAPIPASGASGVMIPTSSVPSASQQDIALQEAFQAVHQGTATLEQRQLFQHACDIHRLQVLHAHQMQAQAQAQMQAQMQAQVQAQFQQQLQRQKELQALHFLQQQQQQRQMAAAAAASHGHMHMSYGGMHVPAHGAPPGHKVVHLPPAAITGAVHGMSLGGHYEDGYAQYDGGAEVFVRDSSSSGGALTVPSPMLVSTSPMVFGVSAPRSASASGSFDGMFVGDPRTHSKTPDGGPVRYM